MNVKKYTFKVFYLLLSMTLCISCFSISAYARTTLDPEKPSTLILQYSCRNVEFQIFKVADVSAYGQFSLTDDFKNYSVLLDTSTQEDWHKIAYTLSGYVMRDNLEPQQCSKTNADGQLVFSDIRAGLYLILGETCINGNYRYTPAPFLIALPSIDEAEQWKYEVATTPKYTKDKITTPDKPSKQTVERQVIKLWKNDDATRRPSYVDVQLLRNGQIWDTIRLTADNNWRYEWKNLNAGYTWQIVEKQVPEGYFVTTALDGSLYVITNSAKVPESPPAPDSPISPDIPSPSSPDVPSPGSPDIPRLPQTGVLWWPVGILTIAGTILLILGLWKRKRKHE